MPYGYEPSEVSNFYYLHPYMHTLMHTPIHSYTYTFTHLYTVNYWLDATLRWAYWQGMRVYGCVGIWVCGFMVLWMYVYMCMNVWMHGFVLITSSPVHTSWTMTWRAGAWCCLRKVTHAPKHAHAHTRTHIHPYKYMHSCMQANTHPFRCRYIGPTTPTHIHMRKYRTHASTHLCVHTYIRTCERA